MKESVLLIFVAILLAACGGSKTKETEERFAKLLEDGELFKLRQELASEAGGNLSKGLVEKLCCTT